MIFPKQILCTNRKANFLYHLDDKYEAGLVLRGSEVKSLRAGMGSITESYAQIQGCSLILHNFHIPIYKHSPIDKRHDPQRPKVALLRAHQITKLKSRIHEKGYTIIMTTLYSDSRGFIKAEIALAKGKHIYDRRTDIKRRDMEREQRREMHDKSDA